MMKCRVCGHALFAEPLLRYTNMPKAAQQLPDAETVQSEVGMDLDVCQCAGCGLVQLTNEPVPYYREVIRAAAFSPEMDVFRRQQFHELLQRYALVGKRVLEVGCGRGEYLTIMQECGADAYGIEYAADAVDDCRRRGLRVEKTYLETGHERIAGAPFHAFYILNFLEHIPQPNALLAGVSNNLADDGIGLVEVPNFDMILRNNLFSEFIADHLYYFTRETLANTLSVNGFEVVECRNIWHDYITSAVVKKRKRLDITPFYRQQEQLTKEIHAFVSRFAKQTVAVWGAGHQALAILALADLGQQIRYVVDSAPFKQNKFTPSTHIPIVAPSALDTDPVHAVIVMAASYSDEVARHIRTTHPALHIVIVRDFGLEEITG